MREHRAALELEVTPAGAVVLLEDLGADDVARHQVGRELDAVEIEPQRLAQRAHEQRLAEPRHAFEHAVAAGEQPDQELLDDLVLANHRARDRGFELSQPVDVLLDVAFGHGVGHGEFTRVVGVARRLRRRDSTVEPGLPGSGRTETSGASPALQR